jgi:hypothetical protein
MVGQLWRRLKTRNLDALPAGAPWLGPPLLNTKVAAIEKLVVHAFNPSYSGG